MDETKIIMTDKLEDNTILRILSLFDFSVTGVTFGKLDMRFYNRFLAGNYLCNFDKYEPELFMEDLWNLNYVRADFSIDPDDGKHSEHFKFTDDNSIYYLTFKGMWKFYNLVINSESFEWRGMRLSPIK
jgi:hypothetical protein